MTSLQDVCAGVLDLRGDIMFHTNRPRVPLGHKRKVLRVTSELWTSHGIVDDGELGGADDQDH
ncbi:hypothetical protein HPP92_024019 [Vanilla planifolia]|uniref:Uncharacterized protein n=1 Tax=Vanilla planifolia TaxID=51239 RepID=A0A835PMJ2_VANPL|nr:hypothetical protein HPP92_024467 [Vanilla planifolia]KAG0456231.1 hypothetical protein HPP92_024019 [Vanilla planifolia]